MLVSGRVHAKKQIEGIYPITQLPNMTHKLSICPTPYPLMAEIRQTHPVEVGSLSYEFTRFFNTSKRRLALGISDPSTVPSTSPNAKAVPAKASVALSILCASKNSARRTWLPLGQLCLFFSEMQKKTEMKIGEGPSAPNTLLEGV